MTRRNPELRTAWAASALLLWGCLVLVGYYTVHKPVSLVQAASLGRALLDLVAAAALAGLAGGLGRKILPADGLHALERLAVQAAAGFGILGLLWLVVGALRLYSDATAWFILVAGWVFLRRPCLHWLREILAVRQQWEPTGRLGRMLAVGSGVLIVGQLMVALAPPAKWDALVYHLELPRRYLEAGRFLMVENNPFWGHPQLFEMLSTWAVALHRPETAVALGWCIGAVLLLGVLGITSRRTCATGGWVAVAALVAGPSFRGLLAWGYVDGLAALYGLAALAALLEVYDDQQDSRRWASWAGCFVGLAMGVKLTAGVLLPVLVLALALSGRRRTPGPWSLAAQAGLISLLVFAPWALKNLLATGNPLYPHIWPTGWASEQRLAFYNGRGGALGWQPLWLPLALTWLGVEGADGFAADIGPLLVLLALPGLVARWRRRDTLLVAVWVLAGWLAITAGEYYSPYLGQTRLYFVLLPAAALAAGWGWKRSQHITVGQVRLRRVMAVLIMLALALSLWQDALSLSRLKPVAVLLGTRPATRYLDQALGWYAPAMRALHGLPPEARPLLLWEPRGLYAPLRAESDTWIDRWYLDRRNMGGPQAILRSWRREGYTHLLLNDAGANFERSHRQELTQADWEALDALLSHLTPLADFGGAYHLYSLAEDQ
jgi:hypothetical protein